MFGKVLYCGNLEFFGSAVQSVEQGPFILLQIPVFSQIYFFQYLESGKYCRNRRYYIFWLKSGCSDISWVTSADTDDW